MMQKIYKKSPSRIKPLLMGAWHTVFEPDSSPETRGYHNPHDFPKEDIYEILNISNPVIIESGANDGGNTSSYLDIFDTPTIHAIEPLPEQFKELNNKFGSDKRVILHNIALGNKKEKINMNVYEDDGSSSVFESNEAHEKYGGEQKTNRKSTIECQQTTINDLVEGADIINLDMQGYELNALKGATEVLQNCKAIIVEVSFVPLYDGQPLFCDISSFLSDYDFHVYDLYFRWKGENGELTHGDAVFLNKSVYEQSDFEVNPFELK